MVVGKLHVLHHGGGKGTIKGGLGVVEAADATAALGERTAVVAAVQDPIRSRPL